MPRLKSVRIQGYRPFKDFSASFGSLEVIVGSNGSGKSSLFEFLRFLRDSMSGEIPPEIIPGSIGQRIFHSPGPEKFLWEIGIDTDQDSLIAYRGELMGPQGRPHIFSESAWTRPGKTLMQLKKDRLLVQFSDTESEEIPFGHTNKLALSTMEYSAEDDLHNLYKYISGWRFYDSFAIDHNKIRKPVLAEQNPILQEDAGNLSSLLLYLMSNRTIFDEFQQILRSAVSSFRELTVKAYGAPGQVMVFWQEEGTEGELTLADLSDGVLHFICWAALFMQPKLPPLICIDEPTQGFHPRMLPVLAEMFEGASERTQILLATHSSYLLTLLDLSRIAVMRRKSGEIQFAKPANSKALVGILDDEDFGSEEIANMHMSDELEILS